MCIRDRDCTVTDCGNEGNVSGVKDIGGFCYELYAGTMTGCYLSLIHI